MGRVIFQSLCPGRFGNKTAKKTTRVGMTRSENWPLSQKVSLMWAVTKRVTKQYWVAEPALLECEDALTEWHTFTNLCIILLPHPSRLVKLFTVSFSSLTWLMKRHLKCIFRSRTYNRQQSAGNLWLSIDTFMAPAWFHLKHQIPHGVLHILWCAAVVVAGHSGAFRQRFINTSFILLCFSGSFEVFFEVLLQYFYTFFIRC